MSTEMNTSFEIYGKLVFLRKNEESKGTPYPLYEGETTIGHSVDADIRLKLNDERLEDIHCIVKVENDGKATLINKSFLAPVSVNGIPVKKSQMLRNKDMAEAVGKKFQYFYEPKNKQNPQKRPLIGRYSVTNPVQRKSPKVKTKTSLMVQKKPIRRKTTESSGADFMDAKTPVKKLQIAKTTEKSKTTSKLIGSKALTSHIPTKIRRLSLGTSTSKKNPPKVSARNIMLKENIISTIIKEESKKKDKSTPKKDITQKSSATPNTVSTTLTQKSVTPKKNKSLINKTSFKGSARKSLRFEPKLITGIKRGSSLNLINFSPPRKSIIKSSFRRSSVTLHSDEISKMVTFTTRKSKQLTSMLAKHRQSLNSDETENLRLSSTEMSLSPLHGSEGNDNLFDTDDYEKPSILADAISTEISKPSQRLSRDDQKCLGELVTSPRSPLFLEIATSGIPERKSKVTTSTPMIFKVGKETFSRESSLKNDVNISERSFNKSLNGVKNDNLIYQTPEGQKSRSSFTNLIESDEALSRLSPINSSTRKSISNRLSKSMLEESVTQIFKDNEDHKTSRRTNALLDNSNSESTLGSNINRSNRIVKSLEKSIKSGAEHRPRLSMKVSTFDDELDSSESLNLDKTPGNKSFREKTTKNNTDAAKSSSSVSKRSYRTHKSNQEYLENSPKVNNSDVKDKLNKKSLKNNKSRKEHNNTSLPNNKSSISESIAEDSQDSPKCKSLQRSLNASKSRHSIESSAFGDGTETSDDLIDTLNQSSSFKKSSTTNSSIQILKNSQSEPALQQNSEVSKSRQSSKLDTTATLNRSSSFNKSSRVNKSIRSTRFSNSVNENSHLGIAANVNKSLNESRVNKSTQNLNDSQGGIDLQQSVCVTRSRQSTRISKFIASETSNLDTTSNLNKSFNKSSRVNKSLENLIDSHDLQQNVTVSKSRQSIKTRNTTATSNKSFNTSSRTNELNDFSEQHIDAFATRPSTRISDYAKESNTSKVDSSSTFNKSSLHNRTSRINKSKLESQNEFMNTPKLRQSARSSIFAEDNTFTPSNTNSSKRNILEKSNFDSLADVSITRQSLEMSTQTMENSELDNLKTLGNKQNINTKQSIKLSKTMNTNQEGLLNTADNQTPKTEFNNTAIRNSSAMKSKLLRGQQNESMFNTMLENDIHEKSPRGRRSIRNIQIISNITSDVPVRKMHESLEILSSIGSNKQTHPRRAKSLNKIISSVSFLKIARRRRGQSLANNIDSTFNSEKTIPVAPRRSTKIIPKPIESIQNSSYKESSFGETFISSTPRTSILENWEQNMSTSIIYVTDDVISLNSSADDSFKENKSVEQHLQTPTRNKYFHRDSMEESRNIDNSSFSLRNTRSSSTIDVERSLVEGSFDKSNLSSQYYEDSVLSMSEIPVTGDTNILEKSTKKKTSNLRNISRKSSVIDQNQINNGSPYTPTCTPKNNISIVTIDTPFETSKRTSKRSKILNSTIGDYQQLATPKSALKRNRGKKPYKPITEDISPASPVLSKRDDSNFKTPFNTPGVFENIKESVLKSRSRLQKSSNSFSLELRTALAKEKGSKRARESIGESTRLNKRRKVGGSQDDSELRSALSFDSFHSEDVIPELSLLDNTATPPPDFDKLTDSPVISEPKTKEKRKRLHRNISQKSPRNDLSDVAGLKRLLKTPRERKSPKNDLTHVAGIRKLMTTPKPLKSPKNYLSKVTGIRKLMSTPKIQKSPRNNLSNIVGTKKLLSTPKEMKSPKNDLTKILGVKKLMATPKQIRSPRNDLTNVTGVKKLMSTPKEMKSPMNDLTNVTGVKRLMLSPKIIKSPENDLRNVVGLRRLMSTPKEIKSPRNDLSDVEGVSNLFLNNGSSDQENSSDLFSKLFEKKPMKTYKGKSMSPYKMDNMQSESRKTLGDVPFNSPRVENWVEEQVQFRQKQVENVDQQILELSNDEESIKRRLVRKNKNLDEQKAELVMITKTKLKRKNAIESSTNVQQVDNVEVASANTNLVQTRTSKRGKTNEKQKMQLVPIDETLKINTRRRGKKALENSVNHIETKEKIVVKEQKKDTEIPAKISKKSRAPNKGNNVKTNEVAVDAAEMERLKTEMVMDDVIPKTVHGNETPVQQKRTRRGKNLETDAMKAVEPTLKDNKKNKNKTKIHSPVKDNISETIRDRTATEPVKNTRSTRRQNKLADIILVQDDVVTPEEPKRTRNLKEKAEALVPVEQNCTSTVAITKQRRGRKRQEGGEKCEENVVNDVNIDQVKSKSKIDKQDVENKVIEPMNEVSKPSTRGRRKVEMDQEPLIALKKGEKVTRTRTNMEETKDVDVSAGDSKVAKKEGLRKVAFKEPLTNLTPRKMRRRVKKDVDAEEHLVEVPIKRAKRDKKESKVDNFKVEEAVASPPSTRLRRGATKGVKYNY